MSKEYKYCAFISYSHKDEKWASWLHKALETYRVPKHLVGTKTASGEVQKRLGKVFRDRDELPSSQDLGNELTQALTDSACLIVICSPNAATSKWTNEEILAYKRLGREQQIFSLIVGGEPYASAQPETADQECFPPALRFLLDADGNLSDQQAEPIAADARPQGDGKQNAKLKLISGMLRVGFDALKQREQQRRQRRLLAITVSALAGMVFATGLATFALMQRNEAEAQRARAETEAEVARETRDFLVGLFKVSDPSEAVGNTITAREILDKGAERIERELSGQPAIQATLMETMGSVYTGLGLYPPATTLLESALAKKHQVFPENDTEIARSLERYGEVLKLDADYAKAEASYRQALAISIEQEGERSAATAGIKAGLGDLLYRVGDYDEARSLFEDALVTQRELLGSESTEVANSLNGLALTLFRQGDYDRAIALLQEAVGMLAAIHAGPHPDRAEAMNNLGLVLRRASRFDEAEALYRQALDMKRVLHGDAHPELAAGLNNLAVVLRSQRRYAEAEEMYRQVIAMQRQLLGDDHPDVAAGLNNIAFVLHDKGDLQGALATARESLQIFRKAFGDEHAAVARGAANLALFEAQARNYPAAETLAQESLAIREKLHGKEHVDTASSMTVLAYILIDTGRPDEGLSLATAARAVYESVLPAGHWFIAAALNAEGAALLRRLEFFQAEARLLQAREILGADPRALMMSVSDNASRLASLYEAWGKPELAAKYRNELAEPQAALRP